VLKPAIAAAAVLALAGSSIVYAQQRFGDHRGFEGGGPRAEHCNRPSAEDMAAFADARIAAFKAGLELTPDQAKNWPAFEQALRDLVQLRLQRIEARRAANPQPPAATPAPTSPFDRMQRRADNLSKAGAALERLAGAGAPLYQSLTDAQKNRFTILARVLRPHRWGRAGDGRGGAVGPGWREGYGYGRGGHWFRHGGRRFGPGGYWFRPNGGLQHPMDDDGDQGTAL
jgi:zinc resistance-associated protein